MALAAALVLIATALAQGQDVALSRGELVEIGAGFRIPDLLVSTGGRTGPAVRAGPGTAVRRPRLWEHMAQSSRRDDDEGVKRPETNTFTSITVRSTVLPTP